MKKIILDKTAQSVIFYAAKKHRQITQACINYAQGRRADYRARYAFTKAVFVAHMERLLVSLTVTHNSIRRDYKAQQKKHRLILSCVILSTIKKGSPQHRRFLTYTDAEINKVEKTPALCPVVESTKDYLKLNILEVPRKFMRDKRVPYAQHMCVNIRYCDTKEGKAVNSKSQKPVIYVYADYDNNLPNSAKYHYLPLTPANVTYVLNNKPAGIVMDLVHFTYDMLKKLRFFLSFGQKVRVITEDIDEVFTSKHSIKALTSTYYHSGSGKQIQGFNCYYNGDTQNAKMLSAVQQAHKLYVRQYVYEMTQHLDIEKDIVEEYSYDRYNQAAYKVYRQYNDTWTPHDTVIMVDGKPVGTTLNIEVNPVRQLNMLRHAAGFGYDIQIPQHPVDPPTYTPPQYALPDKANRGKELYEIYADKKVVVDISTTEDNIDVPLTATETHYELGADPNPNGTSESIWDTPERIEKAMETIAVKSRIKELPSEKVHIKYADMGLQYFKTQEEWLLDPEDHVCTCGSIINIHHELCTDCLCDNPHYVGELDYTGLHTHTESEDTEDTEMVTERPRHIKEDIDIRRKEEYTTEYKTYHITYSAPKIPKSVNYKVETPKYKK